MQVCKIVSDKNCHLCNILTNSAKLTEKTGAKSSKEAWHRKCTFLYNTFYF